MGLAAVFIVVFIDGLLLGSILLTGSHLGMMMGIIRVLMMASLMVQIVNLRICWYS